MAGTKTVQKIAEQGQKELENERARRARGSGRGRAKGRGRVASTEAMSSNKRKDTSRPQENYHSKFKIRIF